MRDTTRLLVGVCVKLPRGRTEARITHCPASAAVCAIEWDNDDLPDPGLWSIWHAYLFCYRLTRCPADKQSFLGCRSYPREVLPGRIWPLTCPLRYCGRSAWWDKTGVQPLAEALIWNDLLAPPVNLYSNTGTFFVRPHSPDEQARHRLDLVSSMLSLGTSLYQGNRTNRMQVHF
jgi:hypothetical protein